MKGYTRVRSAVMAILTILALTLGPVLGSPVPVQAQGVQIVVTELCAAATTGTCGTIAGPLNGRNLVIYVKASAGVSAGVVTVEEADTSSYAGTWSVIYALTTSTASAVSAIHVPGVVGALRVRISTNITGGSVTVVSMVSN